MKGATMADAPRTLSSKSLLTAMITIGVAVLVAVGFYSLVIDTSEHYTQVFCPEQQSVHPDEASLLPAISRAAESTGAQPQNVLNAIEATQPDIGPNRTVAVCFDETKGYVASLNGTLVPKQ